MREGNYNVQTWLDLRTLASIIHELEIRKVRVKTFSSLIKDILEDFEEKECSFKYDSVELAADYLKDRGFPLRQISAKHGRGIRKALREESLSDSIERNSRASELESLLRETTKNSKDSSIPSGHTNPIKEIGDSGETPV